MRGWSSGCGRRRANPATLSIVAGRVLGRHRGIAHFTVGQRKGLGVAAAEPLYVLRARSRRSAVSSSVRARRSPRPACLSARSTGSGRARRRRHAGRGKAAFGAAAGAGDACISEAGAGEAELVLAAPAGAVAPGQAAVLYDSERVLGGGWIRRACGAPQLDPPAAFSYMRAPCGGIAQLVRAGES